jgi:hypothetical protein
MSHTHVCDYAGHISECNGAALRPLADLQGTIAMLLPKASSPDGR